MQYFSPSQGYGYYPPSTKPSAKSLDSLKNSRAPTLSPEPSQAQNQSQSQLQVGSSKPAQNPDVGETNALIRSLDMSMRYSIEYMDTNPLIGEPGSFVFSSTQTRLQEQQAASKAQAAQAVTKAAQVSKSSTASAAATPLAEIKTAQIRKGIKTEKEKTPTSSGPGNKLKQRKSRVSSPQET
jgi:mediator of RNA polymerase II transcription subunit 6